MIRLSKDRVLEDFFIDDNGVITNKEGEVQKVYYISGRSYFKATQVHKIQMWTKYGWRDGQLWTIHHIDENPSNNAISNLVFMLRSEHMRLHRKGYSPRKGKIHTEETKEKIRLGNIGKKISEEAKIKMSKVRKGRKWFNDGVEEYFIFSEYALPHYQKGRLKCKKHTEETKKKISEANKGQKWYNDGVRNYFIFPEKSMPNYIEGMLKRCKK